MNPHDSHDPDVRIDTRLADLRRDPDWSAGQQRAVLDHVLTAGPADPVDELAARRRSTPRRTAILVSAAGVTVAGLTASAILLPSGAPGGPSSAEAVQALHVLATAAARQPVDELGPGQFVHLVEVDHQNALAGQPSSDARYEFWIRADGRTWQRRHERTDGLPTSDEVWLQSNAYAGNSYAYPDFLASLPTDPSALDAYLRKREAGSTSADERVFVAVRDILSRGLARADLRSAAIQVLSRLGHVRIGDATEDSLGNRVQEFDFVDPHGRPDDVAALLFTDSGELTEVRDYFHDKLYASSVIPVLEAVDEVPADVRRDAVPQD